MKQLPKNFTGCGEVSGFLFKQLRASDRAYLYQVDAYGKIHYEVFRKRINKRFGNISYPSSKAFGVWAWTYKYLCGAVNKFYELNNKVENHEK